MVNLMVANILYKLCLRMGFSIPSEEKMFLRQLRPYYVETKQKKVYFSVVKHIPTAELFFLQYINEHFAKYSIITKICSLEEYNGHNTIGKKVDFMTARVKTGVTMESWSQRLYDVYNHIKTEGFNSNYPIEVDSNMRIINGSHRFACACQLGISYVPVRVVDISCDLDDSLFVYEEELLSKFTIEQITILRQLQDRLYDKCHYPFYIQCPISSSERILNLLTEQTGMSVNPLKQVNVNNATNKHSSCLLEINVQNPQYSIDAITGQPFCTQMRYVRTLCKRIYSNPKIRVADNYESSIQLKTILE